MAADGQVTVGSSVLKSRARKIRKIANGTILVGFAGATADAFTLFERFEGKVSEFRGDLVRASVELAKGWRTDRVLRRLEAMLLVADAARMFLISGTGDVVDPEEGVIAIGSGGLTGKGFLEGTQTKYEFLPASHTDFIFSVVGEELGFIGTIAVLVLFLVLVLRGLRIASVAGSRFHGLIAAGLASMLAFHAFINIGMTIGVMPVTGIPLPFISYGGTALLANMMGIGLLLLVHLRRHE